MKIKNLWVQISVLVSSPPDSLPSACGLVGDSSGKLPRWVRVRRPGSALPTAPGRRRAVLRSRCWFPAHLWQESLHCFSVSRARMWAEGSAFAVCVWRGVFGPVGWGFSDMRGEVSHPKCEVITAEGMPASDWARGLWNNPHYPSWASPQCPGATSTFCKFNSLLRLRLSRNCPYIILFLRQKMSYFPWIGHKVNRMKSTVVTN